MVDLVQACISTLNGEQISILLLNLHALTRLQQTIYQRAAQKEPLGFGSKAPQRIDTLLSRVLSHPYLIPGVELSVNLGYCGAERKVKQLTATAEPAPKRQKSMRNARVKKGDPQESSVRQGLAPLKRISLELWTGLFTYLSPLDVIAASQVCKAWYYASIQDAIWATICRRVNISCEPPLLARLVFQRALFENFILKSVKFLALDIILHTFLEEAAESGGKMVLSVMAETRATLDLLEDVLTGRHLSCYRLDHRGLPEVKKDVARAVEAADSPLVVFLVNSAGFRHAPTQLEQLIQALQQSCWVLSLEVPRGNAQQLLADIAQWAAPAAAPPKLVQLVEAAALGPLSSAPLDPTFQPSWFRTPHIPVYCNLDEDNREILARFRYQLVHRRTALQGTETVEGCMVLARASQIYRQHMAALASDFEAPA